ncbi:putative nucleotidyltransferase-like protein [Halopolyspora algeriensis]|uniref:Putative nucleotidyltransferase-like protein n=1 Tax=Halopolyspora algeriensis TaxID=1500506 RepID=A0A368VVF6_9ACTN|nr:nucleotidyltransferase family protein [Halopolyspora algeriensis]RCW44638.1 putative nucleotidyltransferase-like protein [Halopolyspora algeriensis]TQM55999.1 putative nucleotidyltransferase-like protein [Halopolyspora algeriensis]
MEAPEELLQTLTRVSSALRDGEVPFALTGGCAIYARGGPASEHDVDVLVRPQDVEVAQQAMENRGMSTVEPPEDWLVKAFDGDRLVDIIHRPNEYPVTDAVLKEAEELRVGPASVPVMPATHLLVDKLLVLGPHRCDMSQLLPTARALREQIDWDAVRRDTEHSPYAEAFLLLVERLGITEIRIQEAAEDPERGKEPN